MVERVARAMRERQAIEMDMVNEFGSWDTTTAGNRDAWLRLAEWAILAMREPTEAMMGFIMLRKYDRELGLQDWRSAIDEALK